MDGMRNAQKALALRLRNLRGERPRKEIIGLARVSMRTLEGLEGAEESANPSLFTLHGLAEANGVTLRDLFDDGDDGADNP